MSTKLRDEWGTPMKLFEELDLIFKFTLDAAASPENTKCFCYFTEELNGLIQPWRGHRIFVNPPYSGRNLSLWAKKMYEEAQMGCVIVGLILISPDTSWWHDYIFKADALLFPRGRISFIPPQGVKTSSPTRATCLVFFNLPDGVLQSLSHLGKVVKL